MVSAPPIKLVPNYAADRVCVNTLTQANDLCDALSPASSTSAVFAALARMTAMPVSAKSRSSRAMSGGSDLRRKCSPPASRGTRRSAGQPA